MCRNIRPLFNFEPPATNDDTRAAALQFVRKVSGFRQPSKANRAAFDAAVNDIAAVVDTLLKALVTRQTPRDWDARRRDRPSAPARHGP